MKEKGQSVVVSAVLYTLVSLIVVAIVLHVGIPYINNLRDMAEIRQAEATIKNIDELIAVVAAEGEGSRRRINITLSDPLEISSSLDSVIISKVTGAEIVSPRRKDSKGYFFRGVNIYANAFEDTIGEKSVLAIENEHLYFAVKKLDSNIIKLDELIVQVKRKDNEEVFAGTIDLYLDNHQGADLNVSTKFERQGYNLGKGHIIAKVQSPAYSYKINFVLESGFDFVRIYISDLES